MKYLFRALLNLIYWIFEGIYYVAFTFVTLLVMTGYALWNFKLLKNPFKLVNAKFKDIMDVDVGKDEKRNNKVMRIIIGVVTLCITIFLTLLISFFWITLIVTVSVLFVFGIFLGLLS